MAGRGTGIPISFRCHACRSTLVKRHAEIVTLTGRTKPRPHDGNRGVRTSDTSREYRCSCGHVGWSTHIDLEEIERRPCDPSMCTTITGHGPYCPRYEHPDGR